MPKDKKVEKDTQWTDKHYDFKYTLTPEDIERGFIKVDAYFVSHVWNLGERDNNSGVLFHILKTLTRIGKKAGNKLQREITAIKTQADNLTRFIKED